MGIGEQIMYLRDKENITRDELAKKLDLSYWALSKYETNARTPDTETLNKIADFFGTSVDYLHGRSNVEDVLTNWRNRIRNGEKIIFKGVLLTESHIDLMENAVTEKDD